MLSTASVNVLQTQGCNSSAVMQVTMDVIRDYSALSLGVSVDCLTQLVSVSSHFTCNLLTAITCAYSVSGIIICHYQFIASIHSLYVLVPDVVVTAADQCVYLRVFICRPLCT